MEARIIKLIECIESNKSQELSQIAAFQLGQLSKESSIDIFDRIQKLFFHQNIEIRYSISLAFSEILSNCPILCPPPEVPLKFLTFSLESQESYKRLKPSLDPFGKILDSFRRLIIQGSWEEKHGSILGIRVLLKLQKLCKECEEDILCRIILAISQDHTADYSGDLAEFPLITLGAESLSLSSKLNYPHLEQSLSQFLKINTLGIVICFRKSQLFSKAIYQQILKILETDTNEDVITEACHYLARYTLFQDQELADILIKLINGADSLSSFIKYAIRVLDVLFNLNCKLPRNFTKIYGLFVHSLTEVRLSTLSAFMGLVNKSYADPRTVFLYSTQALLLETNQNIIKESWKLVKVLLKKYDLRETISERIQDWNRFLVAKEPSDFSFFVVPEANTPVQEIYSFADNNTEEDIKSPNYLEKKRVERIWRIGKLINSAMRCYNIQLDISGIDRFLWIICSNVEEPSVFYEIINSESEGKLENIRIKGLAVYKLVKHCMRHKLDLPDKISPILQAIVTSYKYETHSLLKEKLAKSTACLTFLLSSRTCNEKFIGNLLKIDPYPVLRYLQRIHQSQLPSLFSFYSDLTNLDYLPLTSHYIHPSLFPHFSSNLPTLLNMLPNPLVASSLSSILTQIPSTFPAFVTYLISYLQQFPLPYTDPLLILKSLLEKQIVEFIPFSACVLLPLLSHLNTENGSDVAGIFSEILYAVMLDSPESAITGELQEDRRQGMEFLSNLKGVYTLPEYVPRVVLRGIELRGYQKEGIAWMRFLSRFRLGGMLCDEMGLGKTIQSLCVVAEAHLDHPQALSLILCPGSVVGHWIKEAKSLLDMNASGFTDKIPEHGLVVMPYTKLISAFHLVSQYNFLYLILDEGHLLNNPTTRAYKAVKALKSEHRLILTGTPIQNKILELWPFFEILMPGFLGTHSDFSSNYQKYLKPKKNQRTVKFNDEYQALAKLNALHKKILPFVLRRLKKDILTELPEKIIQDYYIYLNSLQKEMLSAYYLENTHTQLEELFFLRKLCNHPRLVDPTLKQAESPKIEALQDLLVDCEICEESGTCHKALIFTQMKGMLDIIESDLLRKHFPLTGYLRLDGSTPCAKRTQICEDFNNRPQYRLLIMTTDTGGLGLNLQAADVVIFVDQSWNPIKDLQAMDRAHRIGQRNVVNVYRLITKDTLEEEILGVQAFKTKIAEIVVDIENSSMKSVDASNMVFNIIEKR